MNGVRDYHTEIVAVLDFGSQYTQLIARRIRELNVYCELVAGDAAVGDIAGRRPRGLVLSGGPSSVYDPGALHPDRGIGVALGRCREDRADGHVIHWLASGGGELRHVMAGIPERGFRAD